MKNLQRFSFFAIICILYSLNLQISANAATSEKEQEVKAMLQHQKAEILPDPNGAKIEFEKSEHDFGNISVNSETDCQFKFTNTGKGILKIDRIESTCGCTVPTLEKKIYKPGESGTIMVTYTAGAIEGSVHKNIHVYSNDSSNPKYPLTIKAQIQQKVTSQPDKLNLLLNRPNAGCPDIVLNSIDKVPFSVKKVTSSFTGIKVTCDPNEKGETVILKPVVDVNQLQEYSSGKIDIELTHPQCQMISVRFEVLPKYKLEPRYISLLQAEGGKSVNKQLWILSNYNEEFKIASTEAEKGIVKVLKQEKYGTRYKLDLQVTPPADANQTMFLDKLIIKTAKDEKLEVLCSGFYKFKTEELPAVKK